MLVKGRWTKREIERAKILLVAHSQDRLNKASISRETGCGVDKVRQVISRFQKDDKLEDALKELPRSGQPEKLSTQEKAFVVATACTDPPDGSSHWTLILLRLQLKKVYKKKVCPNCIYKVLLDNDIKPWKKKMWSVPRLDQQYIEKMLDVLEVYEREYNKKIPVVCVDEKSTQLLSTPREEIPIKPGSSRKIDYEYKRNRTVNIFVGVEPLAGTRSYRVTDRRTGNDFAKYIKFLVEDKYRNKEKIVLVVDNLSTHKKSIILEKYGSLVGNRILDRIEWHYTPVHGSWLNMAEIEISMLSRAALSRRHPNKQELTKHVRAFQKRQNTNRAYINWQFTRQDAVSKFKSKGN